jgi:D-sedoheptulose 7-phosphate isomerase
MKTRAIHDKELEAILTARFEQSISLPETFFHAEADTIAAACQAMARRFHQGGRLLTFGNGACATDAQHVSVEFVHPVVVGKRALPAIALTNDSAALSQALARSAPEQGFAQHLKTLARARDIALGFSLDGTCQNIAQALELGGRMGLLTLGLTGADGGLLKQSGLDFCFVVPSRDPMLVQEIHETLYHVLWELVHVFFEHEGMLQ